MGRRPGRDRPERPGGGVERAGLRPTAGGTPHGLNAAGFTERKIQLLRLLDEGLDTSSVPARLNYSERTVKDIIAQMNVRMGLNNRAHAIAYAMRSGVL
ncbi:helix-turn-helix transcriptional regulator [Streptomyces sp. NPDC051453]|uniref:helix-turn-helix domain-containing protein n=1 Tax=Streptomyces sp. NPDC051453 TaxID=3154941 RepID=UPI003436D097